jgi:excisionase family DNA binding protein
VSAEQVVPRLLDYQEASRFLGVKYSTLRALVCKGIIPHVRLSQRIVRFELDALEALIAARRVPAGGT